jgi:hypothetical protein
MKKSRAPDLNEERIQVVLDTLDGWSGKLTWELLIAAVAKTTGITYSRFTFAEYPQIANAFGLKKAGVREAAKGTPSTPRDERVRAALEQAERYRNKANRLEKENQLLLEQFVTWATNAERKGVTVAMLNAPLPKPPRDRSKGVD